MRDTFGHKLLKRELHILRGDRFAIMETRIRIEINFQPSEIIGIANFTGNQGIVRVNFIRRRKHERIIQLCGIGRRHAT
ncbi:Uncharacterised protein [Vibrio cholerae]|nr:Uncharacterised protein [Vibrio cholerae]CSD61184.1 Uncharacterised protein [Vibrio cholerae]